MTRGVNPIFDTAIMCSFQCSILTEYCSNYQVVCSLRSQGLRPTRPTLRGGFVDLALWGASAPPDARRRREVRALSSAKLLHTAQELSPRCGRSLRYGLRDLFAPSTALSKSYEQYPPSAPPRGDRCSANFWGLTNSSNCGIITTGATRINVSSPIRSPRRLLRRWGQRARETLLFF